MASTRILKEIKKSLESTDFHFIHDDLGEYGKAGACYLRFVGTGIYNGQVHVLRIDFTYGSIEKPLTFPENPPNVIFLTPIFHPNIATSGSICLDVIKPEKWSPLYGVSQIYQSILALLSDANINSPFNMAAADEWKKEKNFAIRAMDYYQSGMAGVSADSPIMRIILL